MFKNENQEPLAGGLLAGTLQADHAVDIRESLRNQAQLRLRRVHLARQVPALGDRVFFEFVDELDRVHGLGNDLDQRLERYAALNPAIREAQ